MASPLLLVFHPVVQASLSPLAHASSSAAAATRNPSPLQSAGLKLSWRRPRACKVCYNFRRRSVGSKGGVVVAGLLPVDPWAPNTDTQSIASSLFAASLFPYLGFLYHITKSNTSPKLTLFGFYFLLAFVGATIPAGIYAKVHYGTSLSNVDWLHGGAESLLTLTNLFIVYGLRNALQKPVEPEDAVTTPEEKNVPLSK